MMLLIELLVVLVILFIIGAAAYFIVQKFELPKPVLWIVGAVLLIGLLIYAAHLLQGGGPVFSRRVMP